jgi:hypothetical protein
MTRKALLITAVAVATLVTAPAAGAHSVPGVDSCNPLQPSVPPGAISTSPNVEHLGWVPGEAGDMTAGGRKVGKYFYITGVSHFSIYDVSTPESPKLVSRTEMPCRFENEDVAVTPDGRYLMFSDFATSGSLYVYDVSDKARPRQIADVAGAGTHTTTCVLKCTYLFGSYQRIGSSGPLSNSVLVDLRDPAAPKALGDWTADGVMPSRKVHDVTEVAPGILVTASAPIQVLDARKDPLKPTVIARGPDPTKRYHSVDWPRGGKDKFILADFETNATQRCELGAGDFSVFDASEIGRKPGVTDFKRVSSWYPSNGTFSDGNPTANFGLGCSPHWFDVRPSWKDGGIVAVGAYDHGTKFLRVDGSGAITEAGHFLAPGTNASGAYWITCDIVYTVDYTRGLDVMRFTDEASACKPDGGAED